jgi:hypothetical protein
VLEVSWSARSLSRTAASVSDKSILTLSRSWTAGGAVLGVRAVDRAVVLQEQLASHRVGICACVYVSGTVRRIG